MFKQRNFATIRFLQDVKVKHFIKSLLELIGRNVKQLFDILVNARWVCFNDPAWESSGWVGRVGG